MASIQFFRTPAAAAASLLCLSAYAQTQAPATLPPVTVTGRSDPVLSVSGWGNTPLSETPLQASVFTTAQMKDRGAQRLADMVKADASLSDAYNSEGYWDFLTVRGFVLDNRFNYRRDGLPINAESSIPLDNKERIEVLKGTSGMQAGTSAPGGLVNYVVKRPLAESAYSAALGWRGRGSTLVAADLSQRFGTSGAIGARLNLGYEHLDPQLRNAEGKRHIAALATDWRLTPDTLVELEGETSRRSQPSQPGFSLLGDRLPSVSDPRINLNNQPWSQPVVMEGNTASLRVTHKFDRWRLSLHGVTQRLRTDDRLAFPYGCTDNSTTPATYYEGRYCPDGTYDLYDYRSENERRRTDALEAAAHGEVTVAGIAHQWSVGMLQIRVKNRFEFQSYDRAGTGNVEGTLVTPPNDPRNTPNTNRDERSHELFVRDMLKLNEHLGLWLGWRHTRLKRSSILTNGGEDTSFPQSFNTPFIATSYTFAPNQMVYASWGRGTESDVVPNRPTTYANPGQALPAARSRQLEAGLKVNTSSASWGFAVFDIQRPVWGDECPALCTRRLDGNAHHEGLEGSAAWRDGAWYFQGSLQALRAHRHDSTVDPTANGKRPTNVPVRTAKAQVRYDTPQFPGLSTQADVLAVGDRAVLPDNSVSIPGYAVTDLSLKYVQKRATTFTWRLGVDNVFDRRVWRESPYQYGHVYLYPLAPRTFRASLEVSL